jgi:hypothetical protein
MASDSDNKHLKEWKTLSEAYRHLLEATASRISPEIPEGISRKELIEQIQKTKQVGVALCKCLRGYPRTAQADSSPYDLYGGKSKEKQK